MSGPKGHLDLPGHIIGTWMGSQALADRFRVDPSMIRHAGREGGPCRGWRIEQRKATEDDRGRPGVTPWTRNVYRAAGPIRTCTYVLCDIVAGRLIPEAHGSKAECERIADKPMYTDGPPTKIIEWEGAPPERGVALRRCEGSSA